MKVKILFYQTANGKCAVTDFIVKQPNADKSVLLAVLVEVTSEGFKARGCKFRQLRKKLWEIKVRTMSGEYRFLYTAIDKSHIYILHVFKKKTKKTPKKELDIAMKRFKEIQ